MIEEFKNLEHDGIFATEVKKENKIHKLITDFYCLLVDGSVKNSPAKERWLLWEAAEFNILHSCKE